MKLIRINSPGDGDWVMMRVGGVFNDKTDHVVAMARDERVCGGVVFTGYLGGAITLHMAGDETNWATPDFLWMVYHYGFIQLGCRKLLGLVASNNTRAISIDLRMGFEIEARVRNIFPDGADLLILSMTRDQAKWLKWKPRNIRSNKAAWEHQA
jgi:hypothetical protein